MERREELYDIVYVLKNDVEPDELRYSLRSVEKNFRYNKIWFYGGCPGGIVPDYYVNFRQDGGTKYEKTRSTFKSIFENDEITEKFYLFNDDFFIMRPYNQLTPRTNGSIVRQAQRVELANNGRTRYSKRLRRAASFLEDNSLDTISYECHVPILIDRKKALKILEFEDPNAIFRSTYGNCYEIGGILKPDSKIADLTTVPDELYDVVSTSDESFKKGAVGDYIRNKFQEPCSYEEQLVMTRPQSNNYTIIKDGTDLNDLIKDDYYVYKNSES